MTDNVGIYLFDDVEVLDFAGPFEVFSTALRVKARIEPRAPKAFSVHIIADEKRPSHARGGLRVFPEFDITSHPHLDVPVIQGGVVTSEIECTVVIDWIIRISAITPIIASVCTGVFFWDRLVTQWEECNYTLGRYR